VSTPLTYSYKFGQETVEAFTERYPRGTELLCKMAGISHHSLCQYLIRLVRDKNQVQWEAMKRIIKATQRENWEDFRRVPVLDRRKYLKLVKYNAQDEALDHFLRLERLDKQVQLF